MEGDRLISWLRLLSIPGVGPILFHRLLEHCGGDPEAVFSAPAQRLRAIPGIGPVLLERLRHPPTREEAARQAEGLQRLRAHCLALDEPEYPPALAAIADPPPLLFILGDPRFLVWPRLVAVVGTRQASDAGLAQAARLARDLAAAGVGVASGLAIGIDTAAHRGALHGGGPTLAVIATGLDIPYPERNLALREKIRENGCIVSESPLGTEPNPRLFPMRNRLVSGLCQGVVVVEASLESGSMITARLALEQGREVFAMPGRAGEWGARGVNHLIRQGAKLVEGAADVLEEFAWETAAPPSGPPPSEPAPAARPAPLPAALPEEAVRLLLARLEEGPADGDALVRISRLTVGALSSILLQLELAGLVERGPGNLYHRCP